LCRDANGRYTNEELVRPPDLSAPPGFAILRSQKGVSANSNVAECTGASAIQTGLRVRAAVARNTNAEMAQNLSTRNTTHEV